MTQSSFRSKVVQAYTCTYVYIIVSHARARIRGKRRPRNAALWVLNWSFFESSALLYLSIFVPAGTRGCRPCSAAEVGHVTDNVLRFESFVARVLPSPGRVPARGVPGGRAILVGRGGLEAVRTLQDRLPRLRGHCSSLQHAK